MPKILRLKKYPSGMRHSWSVREKEANDENGEYGVESKKWSVGIG